MQRTHVPQRNRVNIVNGIAIAKNRHHLPILPMKKYVSSIIHLEKFGREEILSSVSISHLKDSKE